MWFKKEYYMAYSKFSINISYFIAVAFIIIIISKEELMTEFCEGKRWNNSRLTPWMLTRTAFVVFG